MYIQCNDYLRSDQAQQDVTLLFIYYAIRQHKNTQYTRKKSTLIKIIKSYKILNYHNSSTGLHFLNLIQPQTCRHKHTRMLPGWQNKSKWQS